MAMPAAAATTAAAIPPPVNAHRRCRRRPRAVVGWRLTPPTVRGPGRTRRSSAPPRGCSDAGYARGPPARPPAANLPAVTISLEKRTEDAQASIISLLKKEQAKGIDLGELVAQVEIAIDFSGSMRPRFKAQADGGPSEVQTVVERALALSLAGLDDDGVVPVHFFHAEAFEPVLVSADNHEGFVDDWAKGRKMGATNYGPPMQAILGGGAKKKGLFGRRGPDLEAEKDAPPKLVLFVTDGAPADRSLTTKLVLEAASRPVFWQFIGLGYKPDFMAKLDTMGNRVIDNVGLVEYSDTLAMTDTEFFDAIIGEFFTQWLPEARRLAITRQ